MKPDSQTLTTTLQNILNRFGLSDRPAQARATALPQISVETAALNEGQSGAALVSLKLSLSKPASDIVTLNYTTLDGTAQAGADYLPASGLVSFAPGKTTATIKIPVLGDTKVEADETLRVQFGAPVNAELAAGASMVTITLTNDDQPTVSLSGATVVEGDAGTRTALLPVSLSTESNRIVTVDYTTRDGTAQAGSDYTATTGTLTFQPGETRQTIRVPVLGDSQVEVDERFTVQLTSPTLAVLAATASTAQVSITNDDLPQLAISGMSQVEGQAGVSEAVIQVSLSAATSQPVTVAYATRDGTALAGSDYTATRGTLRFSPGETRQTLRVPIQGDTVAEPDEQFSVVLSQPANALIDSQQDSATLTLTNDDLPTLRIADLSEPEGNEAARYATLEISLSAPSAKIVTVNYALEDGTATAGSDYLPMDGRISFNPGQTRQVLNIPVLGDTLPEPDESFRVRLSAPVNAWLDSHDYATVTLVDEDSPSLSLSTSRIREGDNGTATAKLTVKLSFATDQPVTVHYATQDGTAKAGADYTATEGNLRFAPGETAKTVAVPVLGDKVAELDESFNLRFSAAQNATVGAAATVILANDDWPEVSIRGVTLAEGDKGSRSATATVSLSEPYGEPVTVHYATQDGTAKAGSDYTATSGTLTFAPGETEKTVAVQVLGDKVVEPDESFKVLLSKVTNALLNPKAASDTIRLGNDDGYKGLPVIDLGKDYGKLIQPVTVDGGHWFYYWDVSGDGTKAGNDSVTHDWLDELFRQDVNGRTGGDGNTDNTYRYATLNGVKLALPTVGNGSDFISGYDYHREGTAVQGTANNPTYDDYLAIWDAYNGRGTGNYIAGTPPGWSDYGYYWSATPAASGHAGIGLGSGYVVNYGDSSDSYVAVEVL